MRLVNIDEFAKSNQNGKTALIRALEKWEEEHPLTEIRIPYGEGWEIIMKKTAVLHGEKEGGDEQ